MEKIYPPELEKFVRQELASGNFLSEADLLNRALGVYCELKKRHNALRLEVETAIFEAERGEAKPLDIEEVIARGNQRVSDEGASDS